MILVKFNKTMQISPDDWEVVSQEMLCNDDTTIGEIREWIDSKSKSAEIEAAFRNKVVIISEPEN